MTAPKRTSINITVECDMFYDVAELWPEGDAPDPVTAEAVMGRISNDQGEFWEEARMNADVRVYVKAPNPHFTQVECLIPEFAQPEWIRTEAKS